MTQRSRGLTIVETLVVLVILGVLLALLLPAVQASRERARETVCKNNLHQINVAVGQFAQVHKRIPGPGAPGRVGGWMIELLPFLEQANLHDRAAPGTPIADAAEILLRQPAIFRCPVRGARDGTAGAGMDAAHYVLVPVAGRESCDVFDAPVDLSTPWASGPEMEYGVITRRKGPHHGGFYYAALSQGVSFMLDGQIVR